MMKHLKKVTFTATAAFVLLLTATTGTSTTLPLPVITEEEEQPVILPMDDAEEDGENNKYKAK